MSQENLQEKEIQLESKQLEHLKNIEKRLYRLTSMRWLFLMGLVRGVSTVIGATIVAAIFFAVLAQLIISANKLPGVDQLIESSGIEMIIDQQVN
ncbi:MAG: DUF5665 domain-containing protein [Candidatus Pacebacteria bacterium]|nr:DUF5665 domain-containing protein [Candidatus Paceibacterota bacterium]